MKRTYLTFLLIFIPIIGAFAQTEEERTKIVSEYDQEKLEQIEIELTKKYEENYKLALELAKLNNWDIKITNPDGSVMELDGVTEDLQPIYVADENEGAGITSRANTLYPGGTLGLNLTGTGMTVGLWEIDATRETHELFEGRVLQVDADVLSNHATHVAGTIIGGDGFQAGTKGMAYDANVRAFNSTNDEAECVSEAATGNLISSHSYGIPAGNVSAYYLGKYDANARNFDQIMYNAPYYLGVFSAGNDRNNGISPTGYDLLTDMSCNKNGMTIAAVNQVSNYTGPGSVVMSSFSSWGPTDDGRIKPDISAKGVSLTSSSSSSNSAYTTMSGTSMATPSTSGTLILLQQYYNNLNAGFMRSSTLRGLACHTADEAGNNDGPDYEYGWGLLNAQRAAQTITDNGGKTIISEITLNPGQTYTINVTASGLENLMGSITWTDPQGVVGPNTVNDQTAILINDLDIRITQGASTFFPWKLDVNNPSFGAITGDNLVDNIEKVDIANPSGTYTISVTHKGTLASAQVFSLIVTGLVGNDCNGDFGGTAYLDACGTCVGGNTGLNPCVVYCTSTYTQSGSEYISNVTLNTINNSTGDAPVAGYEDFTSINTTLTQGSVTPISVTINTAGNYTDHCQVFIDWNQNGLFSDPGEMTDLGDITNVTAGVLSGNITVPAAAVIDTVRMRVNLEYNVNPGPCDADHSSEWGETEDYSVIVVGSGIDCNGDSGGSAYLDNCSTCVGGNTGLTACVQDCNSDWGGTAYFDNCNVCVEGNTGLTACVQDCNGDWGGTAYLDNCNSCVEGNTGLLPCIACNTTVTAYPNNKSFDSGWGSFTQLTDDDFDWTRQTGATVSAGTGPTTGYLASSHYIYMEASTPNYPTKQARVMSACYDLSPLTAPLLSFSYHMMGTSVGTLDLKVSTDDGNTWSAPIWTKTSQQGTDWLRDTMSLSAYAGQTVRFLFDGVTDAGWSSDIALDQFTVFETPVVVDCNGDAGGAAYFDNCSTCVGGNTGLSACTQDCNGDWGGIAYIDNCSICVEGNTGLTACVQDCNGDWGGTAYIDGCGTCVAGNTGLIACVADCYGVLGGTAYIDNCNTCVGGTTGLTACVQDCNGDWGGTAYIDNCSTCVEGITGLTACVQDCNGDWGGTAYIDGCGTCVAGNTGLTACVVDCYGVLGGTAYIDNCNTCVGGTTGLTACVQDCNGDWGGTAYADNCNTCVEGNTGLTACVQDCNNDWGGIAYMDNCDTCVEGNTGLLPCVQDCNNDWGGTAVIDSCGTCVEGNTGVTGIWNTVDCFAGLYDKSLNSVIVYPNPSNGMFLIQLSDNYQEVSKIEIYTADGKLVYRNDQIEAKEINVDLSNRENGMYFIHLDTENNKVIKKIILNR